MIYRTTVRDSWRWMRLDAGVRLVPLTLAPVAVALVIHVPLSTFGLSLTHVGRDLLVAIPFAVLGFVIAAAFAEYLARRNRRWYVADSGDLLLQTSYYVLLNAPVEELFFRGFLQGGLTAWLKLPALALILATALFGGYHFLDRWGWRPVAGATAAGLALGLIYLWQPAPASLLAPVIVHAAITCGFLGLGPYVIFRWRVARQRLRIVEEPVRQ
jgi:membrane protease YdiL (CAAX protease family)